MSIRNEPFPCRSACWLAAAVLCLGACAPADPSLNRPNGVAVAADGSLLVVDKNHYRVVRMDRGGQFLQSFGGLGNRPRNLPAPYDIDIGPDGSIYVCDRSYSRTGDYKDHDGVKVFGPDGRFLREIGGMDYRPGEPNNGPYGLDVDAGGHVWIADYHANRIRHYDPAGNLVRTFGKLGPGPGELSGPNDVAVDRDRGVVYVLEAINARVQSFSLDGEPGIRFGGYGRGPEDLSYPQYLDLDPDGNLYVSDMGNRRIQKFSPDGTLLGTLGLPEADGDLQLMGLTVRRVAVGSGFRQEVLAADTLNNRILIFEDEVGLRGTVG